MREKLAPWLPAIFCAALSLITMVSDIVGRFVAATAGAVDMAFYAFLPMAFFFVGAVVSKMQQENHELRQQLKELLSKP